MAYSTTVPILAGLTILGSMTGVSIGRSTIAQINPVYFQPPSSHFYSELTPNRGPADQQPDLGGTDYVQADYAYSAAPGCGACMDYPVDYKPRHDKAVDVIEDSRSASASSEPVLASETEWREPAPANRDWVDRYTDYQVAAAPVEPAPEEVPVQPEA